MHLAAAKPREWLLFCCTLCTTYIVHGGPHKRHSKPAIKNRESSNFILFHSILHGRQPPQEYGIKLLLQDEEEQHIVVSARGDTRHMLHNQVARTRDHKVLPIPHTRSGHIIRYTYVRKPIQNNGSDTCTSQKVQRQFAIYKQILRICHF